MVGGISIIGAIIGILFVNWTQRRSPARRSWKGVGVSALISAVLLWPITASMFSGGDSTISGAALLREQPLRRARSSACVMTGIVVLITNYYTSTAYSPVRKIAKASETGHATNIIAGLALGQHATALPVIFIAASIWVSYECGGLYGIAIAVMAMLSMAGIIISLDAFGPITDNAGGIAVMSGLPKEVRAITDDLDAVGNTMKAVTKGYAIASAGLAALVLFGSYVQELGDHLARKGWALDDIADLLRFSLNDPKVIIGLFIGGLLPFMFAAFSMDAVGKAAGAVVNEVRRQIAGASRHPHRHGHARVRHLRRHRDQGRAARNDHPGAAAGGRRGRSSRRSSRSAPSSSAACSSAPSSPASSWRSRMTSSGGAWDNAKKYIEEGNLGGKGSPAHAAAVTGDTVGDPYKDTSGPAINPMIKVVNIVAILIIPIFF